MRTRLVLTIIVASMSVAYGQKVANPTAYANSITADDLRKHLFIVAGTEMQGRETATEGERKAAAYIENQFRSLGLQPGMKDGFQMKFPLYQDSLVHASIEVNGKKYEMYRDFAVPLATANNSTLLASEIVYVGYGVSDSSRDDYKGINARGKVVLVMPGAPITTTASGRRIAPGAAILEAALKNGAAAILMVQQNFPRKPSGNLGFQTTNAFKSTIYPNLYHISEEVARDILGSDYTTSNDALKAGNAQPKIYQANIMLEFQEALIRQQSSNVIGYIEGTDKKDEYLVITAHYDHLGSRGDSVIYYGADDDGSGTVSVLELAEAFTKAKQAGKGPRRTIVFMTVSGEEKGLWGSAFYGEHPAFPLEKTTANLNIDMIGRIDPKRKNGDSTNYVYVVGDDKLSTDLRPISEAANKKYTKMELDYKYNDPNDTERIYFRSDHYNFARKGVPIIFYFNGTHADYHRPTDTPDKINYDLMQKRARLVFFTAWEMANRNEMLKRDLTLEIPSR